MGACSTIMAVLQENRAETAVKVQDVLTKYGCHIRVRLGLNDGAVDTCSNRGLILLQLCGENFSPSDLEKDLLRVPDVKVKYMTLDF